MNWRRIEVRWAQLSTAASVKWHRLTREDLDRVAGEREQLVGVLQLRYATPRAQVEREIDDWVDAMSGSLWR